LTRLFDAEDMQILGAAFDKAWEAVQANGVIYPNDKVELVRAILAKHIIAAAKDGERDHSRLYEDAVRLPQLAAPFATGRDSFPGMIYGPRDDGTYVVEFRTAGG
jgi:hypothetical protein